jgi:CHY zinc finger
VPGAPFPITVTATINAPPNASHIDVDFVQIKATIIPSPASTDTGNKNEAPQSGKNEPFFTTLEIEDNSLPSKLKQAILSELDTIQHSSSSKDNEMCHLGPVLRFFEEEYARLLCLVPECLERYQGEDAAGRTVRRVAILREDAQITIDISIPHSSPKAAATPPPAAAAAATTSVSPLPRALQTELEALKKRYAIQIVDSGSESAAIFEKMHLDIQQNVDKDQFSTTPPPPLPQPAIVFNIAVTPTDPEWKPPGSLLHLTCFINNPSAYPAAGSFGVALRAQQSSAPSLSSPSFSLTSQEIAVCDRLLQMEVAGVSGRPGALRAVLRQCENRAGELFHQAVDIAVVIERRRAAVAESAGVIERDGKKAPVGGDKFSSSEYSNSEEDWGGHSDDYNSEDSHEEEVLAGSVEDNDQEQDQRLISGQDSQREAVLVHNSLHLALSDLNLVDIDTLDILKLTLQVACQRCQAASEALFAQLGAGGDSSTSNSNNRKHLSWTGECDTCHSHLEVTVAPRIVHDGSNILAVVRPTGCVPRDMLPSMLAAQCSSCSSMAAFRSVQLGKWNERNCGHCHRRMAFLAPAVEFTPVQRSGGGGRHKGTADDSGNLNKSKSDRDIVITPGQPLPDYGTCRHYRHSKRWLRFPCCGHRFPCDLCHEEATDGHEMKWAGRMVCGFCSVEQPLNEKCTACGRTLATSANRPSGRRTAFWEGGEGQRDKNKLSKRDPHKFRGSKFKTRSKKDLRVGQKGKEKTERAGAGGSGGGGGI